MSTHTAIGSTGLNNVSTLQLPTPTPDADEVLIEMNYSSLIAFDTYQVDRGFYVGEYPHVLGFSGAGKVKSVGGQVNDLKEGDRVSAGYSNCVRLAGVLTKISNLKVAAFTFPQAKNKSLQDYTVIPRFNVAKVCVIINTIYHHRSSYGTLLRFRIASLLFKQLLFQIIMSRLSLRCSRYSGFLSQRHSQQHRRHLSQTSQFSYTAEVHRQLNICSNY